MSSDGAPDSGPGGGFDGGLLAPVRAGTRAESLTSDAAWARAMLEAAAALARAQARAGFIPAWAAETISRAAAALTVNPAELARRARRSATPVVPLVADLRAAAGDSTDSANSAGGTSGGTSGGAARFVHLGATSQDIVDSAAMLVASRAVEAITADLEAAMRHAAELAGRHRETVMAARTLGQHAVPTTFGLKAAGWLAGLLRARDRLRTLRLPAQLGGAAGTLAALVETASLSPADDPRQRALALVDLYAEELGLAAPRTPWHADRSPVAELGAALAATAEALGKVATDVVLLAQTEVGEVAESAAGGSSAMPHKRNPARSVLIRSAAYQVPVYAQLLGRAGEHERAAGAWQAEWTPLRECLRLTGGAAETAAELLAGLEVFPDRMRANAGLTGGRLLSERLAAHLARDELDRALAEEGPLRAPEELLDPGGYLGAARELTDRILAGYRDRRP